MSPEQGEPIGWFHSAVLGVVEGLTEFLPVSSTGHLIVANRLLGGEDAAYEIAIQIGAISAIAVLYRTRLLRSARELFTQSREPGRVNLWILLVVAAIPAATIGLWLDDIIEELLFTPTTVATTLVLGGVLLLWLERWIERRAGSAGESRGLDRMTIGQAFGIGVFQCLALIPGTSRSGSTIAGGLLLGFNRVAAAEFSFFVGLPVLYGACLLKFVGDYERFLGPMLGDFLIGCGVSFVTAYVVVGPFVRFLQRHTFRPFGYYRIVAGAALFAMIGSGWL